MEWMTTDSPTETQRFLVEAEKRNAMRKNAERYRVIGQLLSKGTADITQSNEIFAALNQERMCIEDYMKFFPEDCDDAVAETKERRSADDKDYNRQSQAKWRVLGFPPSCVSMLYAKVYPNHKDRKKAYRRFFNNFPQFRVGTQRLSV